MVLCPRGTQDLRKGTSNTKSILRRPRTLDVWFLFTMEERTGSAYNV